MLYHVYIHKHMILYITIIFVIYTPKWHCKGEHATNLCGSNISISHWSTLWQIKMCTISPKATAKKITENIKWKIKS